MAIIGITGGPACGKSAALEAFGRLGEAVLDSDALVHGLYRDDEELRQRLVERWGPSVFTRSGQVDRRRLATTVFAHAEDREWLNARVHPRVRGRIRQKEQETSPETLYCAVPLLYEVSWQSLMVAVCAVWCPPRRQRERLRQRGWSPRRVDECIRAQMPAEEKLERADFGLINAGSRDGLLRQCRRVRARVRERLNLQ